MLQSLLVVAGAGIAAVFRQQPAVVEGGEGRDRIWGEDGDDELLGQGGDDEIDGGAGTDVIDAGNGRNTIRDVP